MTKGQGEAESLVFVVDDDVSVRQALTSLLQSVALRVEAFGSAADFLKKGRIANGIAAACLILDIRLPGVSGLDFQAELAKADTHLPIIFISGYGDISMTVRAMKAGAIEFLTKPFRDRDLLDAVQLALQRDRDRRIRESAVWQTRARFEALTPREQELVRQTDTAGRDVGANGPGFIGAVDAVLECAPDGGQFAGWELTGAAGLSEDESHGQASHP